MHAVADRAEALGPKAAAAPDPGAWLVAQLKPNGLRLAETHLARQGFETFAPWRLETSRRGRRIRSLRRPLFPGYLFVRAGAGAGHWRAVQGTRGVARLLLRDARNPAMVPAGFVEALRARCDGEGRLAAPPDLALDDRVRVIAGPFAELVGRIEELDGPDRVGLLVSMMGREMRATLSAASVQRLP